MARTVSFEATHTSFMRYTGGILLLCSLKRVTGKHVDNDHDEMQGMEGSCIAHW